MILKFTLVVDLLFPEEFPIQLNISNHHSLDSILHQIQNNSTSHYFSITHFVTKIYFDFFPFLSNCASTQQIATHL